MGNLANYQQRISELAPELSQNSIALNQAGLVNDVVIVNDEFVFRFPKQEHAFRHLAVESVLLRSLQKFISLPIPCPLFEADDCIAYGLIPGESLRRDLLLKFAEDDQQAVANQLAQFLRELHGVALERITEIEIPMADALMKYEGWVGVYERIREKVFPLLMPHLREWATEHFETHLADRTNFDYELKLVDTDLPPYHILFDRQSRRLTGIIDFGCAGLGDPAIDLGVLMYNYGESFVRRIYGAYPEAENYQKRARFYAGAHEVRWLLTGIERNDPWWFAVHVGSAKDIGDPTRSS
jgi:aminoglycoside 2''-phosphotransferase